DLVVKVKNCTDPKLLPIAKNCAILEEYCRFIEIVESTYSRRFPRSSFRKAIEKAVSEGILSDYLSRKTREVTNMLCAKYDYKMDIAVKQEEAFEDGMEKGMQQKAIENAITLVRQFNIAPELAAEKMGAPLDKVLEKLDSGNAGR
ncbi:MAG: hypothetical protein II070_03205, partial [Treponema sp.]|nr:hypothetical protein [Treponema sp.]